MPELLKNADQLSARCPEFRLLKISYVKISIKAAGPTAGLQGVKLVFHSKFLNNTLDACVFLCIAYSTSLFSRETFLLSGITHQFLIYNRKEDKDDSISYRPIKITFLLKIRREVSEIANGKTFEAT